MGFAMLSPAERARLARVRKDLAEGRNPYEGVKPGAVSHRGERVIHDITDDELHRRSKRWRERREGVVTPHVKEEDPRWVETPDGWVGVCWGCRQTMVASRLRPLDGLSPYMSSHLANCPAKIHGKKKCTCPAERIAVRAALRRWLVSEFKHMAWACDQCAPELFGRVDVGSDKPGQRVPGAAVEVTGQHDVDVARALAARNRKAVAQVSELYARIPVVKTDEEILETIDWKWGGR